MISLRLFAVRVYFILTCIIFFILASRSYLTARLEQKNANRLKKPTVSFVEAITNSTLGFSKIYIINIPGRFDRLDAATIQGFLSGVHFEVFPAVVSSQIKNNGMPPTHRPGLTDAEKGCWRAHANIWSQMLRENISPVLILESDAAWDINIRAIMKNLNENLALFLRQINSTVQPGIPRTPEPIPNLTPSAFPDPSDPWHSKHWDLLSLGQCHESPNNHETMLKYVDDHVPIGKEYWGHILGNERVVRKSGGLVCTTAYAISQTGAAKLLLRTAIDLDNPVDLVMRRMIMSGDLLAYSVQPAIISQWEYVSGIHKDIHGVNSDIRASDGMLDQDAFKSGWDTVVQSGNNFGL